MNNEHEKSSDRQRRLEEVLVAYLEAVESGAEPNQQELLGRHPEFADELAEFIAGRHQVDELAAPIREAVQPGDSDQAPPSDAPTTGAETGPPGGAGIGTRVRYFGDYELLEEIARGGMGVIYRARQTNLKRIVALKMILAGQLAGEQDVQRFHAEAEAAAKLDHPGIVPIYEVGVHEGQHYFSMGYVEGESLAHKVAAGPLPAREAAELTRKIAEAVAYAHGQGVIHRDLKPANVLLDKDGQPRISDFGLAKRVEADSDLTATGQILGTPSYMPPEQAAGKLDQIKETADVYSLGALLYTLLSGRPPFQADNPLDTLLQVLEQEPVSPRLLNPSVPRDLDTMCLKCLDKEPRRRYASAEELADELQRFLKGEPIQARPIRTPARAWRWCKRKPALASLLATLVVVFLGGFVGVASQWIRAESQKIRAENHAAKEAESRQEAEDAAAAEREARKQIRRHLYVAHMNLVPQAWEAADVGHVHELLERHRPEAGQDDLRGFVWYYWWRCSHRYAMNLEHRTYPYGMAFSPDGETLAVGGKDFMRGGGELKLWDVASGKTRTVMDTARFGTTTAGSVESVAFSPDGTTVASGSTDGTVKLWHAATGQLKSTLKGHTSQLISVAYSPDGKTLASVGHDRTVKLWDMATGELKTTLKGHSQRVNCVAFSPDGKSLASGSTDRGVKLWDVATGELKSTLKGPAGSISSVVFSPDGKVLAYISKDTLNLWELATRKLKPRLTGADRVAFVAFSPDGETLALGFGLRVKLCDVATGALKRTLTGHSSGVLSVAFSPDGNTLASASADLTVKLWDLAVLEPKTTLKGHRGWVRSVAFSPDGKTLASAGNDRTVRLWDVATGELKTTLATGHEDEVLAVAFSPDGKTLASASDDGTVKLWDLPTRKLRATIKREGTPVNHGGWAAHGTSYSVTFSPDGKTLTLASRFLPGKLNLWDVATGELKTTLARHRYTVVAVVFSPDGKMLATGSERRGVTLWDVATGEPKTTMTRHTGRVASVAFSPDGKTLASGGEDRTVNLWDVATGKPKRTLKGHTGGVSSLAFSPDGKTLASSGPKTVTLWDVAVGEPKTTLTGHTGAVECVAFSPDGKTLASGSWDGTVRLWRAATEEEVLAQSE